jgi:hypothetical protein
MMRCAPLLYSQNTGNGGVLRHKTYFVGLNGILIALSKDSTSKTMFKIQAFPHREGRQSDSFEGYASKEQQKAGLPQSRASLLTMETGMTAPSFATARG